MNYIDFAYKTYKENIFTKIDDFDFAKYIANNNLELFKKLKEYCIFEDSPSGRRFYPSSLFILFYRSFSNKEPTEDIYKIAAAIELFHNSSLTHDDVIDEHDYRREKETILKTSGSNIALLAGNLMIGLMNEMIDSSNIEYKESIRKEFSRATLFLNHGQFLDENKVWNKVVKNDWSKHWNNIITYKMITGFLAVRCAYILSGQFSNIDDIDRYEMIMSEISQIINDTGDLYKFYGYYISTKTIRESGEEITKKVTYPLIWLVENDIDFSNYLTIDSLDIKVVRDLLEENNFYQITFKKIEKLKSNANDIISKYIIKDNIYSKLVLDFTMKPNLPPKNIFTL